MLNLQNNMIGQPATEVGSTKKALPSASSILVLVLIIISLVVITGQGSGVG